MNHILSLKGLGPPFLGEGIVKVVGVVAAAEIQAASFGMLMRLASGELQSTALHEGMKGKESACVC